MTILVLIESENGKVSPISFELLGMGKKLAGELEEKLHAVVVGYKIDRIADEISSFADKVYSVDDPTLEVFHSDLQAEVLTKLCREIDPSVLLLGHTSKGMDVAPRLAYKLKTKLTTDCVDLVVDKEKKILRRVKPIYGGNAIANFEFYGRPQLVTLRPKVVEPAKPSLSKGEIVSFKIILERPPSVESIRKISEEAKLADAEAIVSGGRGIGGIRGFEKLQELSELLKKFFEKVAIGASRPPCDAGWVPKSYQVGLTGEKVSPKFYIAVGISGSVQHLAGIAKAGKIVAINKDPNANIFKAADYGVVGEYEKVLPTFLEKLREFT